MLTLHPSDIEIGERRRALSEDAVSRLANSMQDIGLRQPITVRVVDEMMVDGHLTAGVPVLVTGAHRLAAAKKLGWQEIECLEVEDDKITAELWELSENLHRLDLTKEQRDEHIRRYAELLEARERILAQVEPVSKKGPGQPKGTAQKIADDTGLSKSTVQRALNGDKPTKAKPIKSDEQVMMEQANAIINAWNRASPEAREIALSQIDGPVFDMVSAAA